MRVLYFVSKPRTRRSNGTPDFNFGEEHKYYFDFDKKSFGDNVAGIHWLCSRRSVSCAAEK